MTRVTRLNSRVTGADVMQAIGLPASNGTDDTAALNALLATAAGKTVRGKHGESYQISAPLAIPSGSTLDMTNCTVTLKSGSNCNMLNNAAVTPVLAGTDGAITSGSAVLTSPTLAAVAVAGQTVNVVGADTGAWLLTAKVVSVAGNNITLTKNAGTTVASGGTVTLYNRDSNIAIIGGTWSRPSVNQGTNGWDKHSLRFRHVDGLMIRDMAINTSDGKFAVSLADVTKFRVRELNLAAFSDGVHVMGPASNGTISNVYGTTGDDSIVITPTDWSAYTDSAGDVTDVTIENIYTTSTNAAVVKVLGGSPATSAQRVRVRNIFGAGNNNAIYIGDDTAQAGTTGGLVDALTIEDVSPSVPAAQRVVWLNGSNMRRIRLSGLQYDSTTATVAAIEFTPLNAATLQSLVLENLSVQNLNANPLIRVGPNGTVTRMVIDKVTIAACASGATGLDVQGIVTDLTLRAFSGTLTGSTNVVSLNGGNASATVTRASISDCHVIGTGGNLISATTSTHTLPNVEVSNCMVSGTAWLCDLNTTTELHLSGVTFKSPTQGIANIRANAVVTFAGDGTALAAGGQNIKVTAGGKAVVRTWDIPPSTTAGGFPTIAAGAGAGTGPTVTVAGTDRAGTVTVVVGTTPAAGVLATITFVGTWPQAPKVSLTPTLTAASQAAGAYVSSKTTTTFVISCANAPSGTVTFDYVVAD